MPVEWLQALGDWPVAALLRRSLYVYPLVNAAHILALALLIGAILPADLRILVLFPRLAAAPFLRAMAAVSAFGLLLAAVTGFLLFSVQPLEYAANPAFLAKVSLVALGTANALAVRCRAGWRQATTEGEIGAGLKLGAAFSLSIWLAALLAGRWIAFV